MCVGGGPGGWDQPPTLCCLKDDFQCTFVSCILRRYSGNVVLVGGKGSEG